jgi:hypothetical protein
MNMENGHLVKVEKWVDDTSDIDLKLQKPADSGNDHDFAELGRHAQGIFEVDYKLLVLILMCVGQSFYSFAI